jgi:large subunit ribosomal protein L11
MDVSVLLNVFNDRSFEMIIKGPPVSVLLKKYAGIAKGSGTPNKEKVGKVTKAQVQEIIQQKKEFFNSSTPEKAMLVVEGTARSMGIEIIP